MLEFISLGQKDYSFVLELQLELRRQRQRDQIADTILTVEHPPVITEGRRPAEEDYQVSPEELKKRGIATAKVNRGGRLTYHGPGQLVGYYIISLKERGLKVTEFVRAVEETVLKTLHAFGLKGGRRKDYPGVWLGERKIASIGLSIDRGVSMHGMALNIQPNFEHFQLIVPCGISECEMTSLGKETGQAPAMTEVEQAFQTATRSVFN